MEYKVITGEQRTYYYTVRDIDAALSLYTHIEFERSRSGLNGLYEPAMAAAATGAQLNIFAKEPHALNGRTLELLVNGTTPVTVTFTGSDPYTNASLVSDLSTAGSGQFAASTLPDRVHIETLSTGSSATIEVTGGDAVPFLKLEVGDTDVGRDPYVTLVSEQSLYTWTDNQSSEDFYYRVRLRNISGTVLGPYSVPFPGNTVTAVTPDNLIPAQIRLMDMQGKPLVGRRVTIANVFLPNLTGGYGVFRHYVQFETDETGYGEILLVRGSTVDVSVDGTGFTRRIEVPMTGAAVNLLDPSLVAEDEFGIQEMNIDFAVRLS